MARYHLTLVLGLFLGMMAAPAGAGVTYSFMHIVEDGDGPDQLANGAIGEAQLFVDVDSLTNVDFGDGLISGVLFTFRNIGPVTISITDVYFNDGSLLDLVQLIDFDDNGGDPEVDFSVGATPAELPGGNNADPLFETTPGFSADSDIPVFANGVNPGEELGVFFTLQSTQVFDDVIAKLADGRLRIGIKVQGYDDEGSESFVNVIPAPGALLLGSMGVGLVGWLRRRRVL